MTQKKKIIGTLVPVSALSSLKSKKEDQGIFETGLYFLDWLHKTNQSAWQLLPLHQTQLEKGSATRHVPSPYKGYGIGLDPRYLSVGARAQERKSKKEIEVFVNENKEWIGDYALFCALRDHLGTDDWREWIPDLRKRKKIAIDSYSNLLKKEIDQHILVQYHLHKEYKELKNKAKKLKIKLIGDLPFYVSMQSPLVWANQGVFQFEKDGRTRYVSGIPDSPSAHFGRQVWGHPLYKWGDKTQSKRVVDFWKCRLHYLSLLFDSIRFDHAKGLFDYGEIDLTNENNDKYIKGPGHVVFEELMLYGKRAGLSIFAEDSGEHLSELRNSLNKLKTPGIKILRFALNEKKEKINKEYAKISNYPALTVAYTTTHDTETLLVYLRNLSPKQRKSLARACGVKYNSVEKVFAKNLRDGIIDSPAETVIISIQDWLLTTDRINIPGTEKEVGDRNWQYKLKTSVENLPSV